MIHKDKVWRYGVGLGVWGKGIELRSRSVIQGLRRVEQRNGEKWGVHYFCQCLRYSKIRWQWHVYRHWREWCEWGFITALCCVQLITVPFFTVPAITQVTGVVQGALQGVPPFWATTLLTSRTADRHFEAPQKSSVHPSSLLHSSSLIPHPSAYISHSSSLSLHPHPSFFIPHPLPHPSTLVLIIHPTSFIPHSSPFTFHPPSFIGFFLFFSSHWYCLWLISTLSSGPGIQDRE